MSNRQNIHLSYIQEVQNRFDLPIEISKDLIICPHCKRGISHPAVTYAGGKGTSSPRFWCKACQKKFGIRHKSINWLVCFDGLYHTFFTKKHERAAFYARYNDFLSKSSMVLFDRELRTFKKYEKNMKIVIEKAFVQTLKIILDKATTRLSEKDYDNWSIIINKYSSDQCYDLDFRLLKLENKGIVFHSKQDRDNSLLRCMRCKGNHIAKNGYSGAGRRRFKCTDCDISFVLRARNLFDYSYVRKQVLETLQQSFNFKVEKIQILDRVCNEMSRLFMREKNMSRITKKLQNEFTVHELFRVNEIEVFMAEHSRKYEIIRSKTSEVFEKMILPSNTLLLFEPKEHVEASISEMFVVCDRQL